MTEESKQYRILATTELTDSHEKYRGQVGSYVHNIVEGVILLEFNDGCQLAFALEDIEEVMEEVKE